MQNEKIIIIGSGPAGHTAAIYAARANLKPLLFEGRMAGGIPAGGQLTTTTDVENFPGFPGGISGPMLMERMREHSVKSGTRIITKTVESVDLSSRPFKVTVDNESYSTDALIIATGATAKKLNIPGLDTFWMKGISGCAVCDGALPIFRNKPLVVVGGGDVAMEEALHLAKFGSEVTIVIRRGIPDLRASKAMQEKVFASEKIKILEYTEVLEAKGTKLLENVTLTNNRSGEKWDIPCNGLFFAIGHTPNTSFLGGQIETDESGYIITKPGTTQTSVDGVFAAGDVQDRVFRQAITSAGTGCMAALEAEKWLLNNA